MGWLWRTFVGRFGCEHKWKVADRANIFETGDRPVGWRLLLQCERCGDIKKRDLT